MKVYRGTPAPYGVGEYVDSEQDSFSGSRRAEGFSVDQGYASGTNALSRTTTTREPGFAIVIGSHGAPYIGLAHSVVELLWMRAMARSKRAREEGEARLTTASIH